MDLSLLSLGILAGLLVLGALALGIVIGTRHSRRARTALQLELNRCNLSLLDARSELAALQRRAEQQPRKDRLLVFLMKRVKALQGRQSAYATVLQREKNRHFAREARLKLALAESRQTSERARSVATRAVAQVRRLQEQLPATQTIRCPTPKSYGIGEPVTVSVVDQRNTDARKDAVARMSNRDSARLSHLSSSNEGRRFNADEPPVVGGSDHDAEPASDAADDHRVDPLANLPMGENREPEQQTRPARSARTSRKWAGNARALPKQNLPTV